MISLRFLLTAGGICLLSFVLAPATMVATEIPNAVQPQLTTGADGRIWLVYAQPAAVAATHDLGHGHKADAKAAGRKGHAPGGRAADVFVSASNDGGATFAPAQKVAHVPQLMLGNRRGPRIVAQGDRITVTVIAHELIAFTSLDAGKSWTGPVTINDVPNSAHEGLHDLAVSRDGELFVTWLDLRRGTTELWGAASKDAGRTWTTNQALYQSPDKSICECCHPSALFDREGNLAVMWRNSIGGSRDMWMMTRPKGAAQFTAARKLGEGSWKINACPHDGGALVALGAGKFGAVWQRAGEVFLIRSEGAETSLGKGRQIVAAGSDSAPLFVWQDGTDLVSQRGMRGGKVTKHPGNGRFPVLAALPGRGSAVIAYERAEKDNAAVIVERL